MEVNATLDTRNSKLVVQDANLDLSARPLRVIIVGHVDHGKSTLVGRLLRDTGSLPTGKFEQIQAICRRRGVPFEWAFLMDAFQAERDQNITIDISQIWFRSSKRHYVIIDAPGHKEFLKNMVTGAATADGALLLIAADEGVQEQSRRHAYLLSMLGINQVVVLVNKMDLAAYAEPTFRSIEKEYRDFLAKLGVRPLSFIPISARDGINLSSRADRVIPWFQGSQPIRGTRWAGGSTGCSGRAVTLCDSRCLSFRPSPNPGRPDRVGPAASG
jgi:bifunctional enzyme CysN/CysC